MILRCIILHQKPDINHILLTSNKVNLGKNKDMKKIQILGMFIGIISMALAWIEYDWKLSLIIFLALFGNNLEQSSRK
jgi:hypothetical protein